MARIYSPDQHIDLSVSNLPTMPRPNTALMVTPRYFDVKYVINPYMANQLGSIDKQKAWEQWEQITHTFERLGLTLETIEGRENLPDMVFSANQSLPYCNSRGQKEVIMSIMHAPQRREEVAYIEQWYRQSGYQIHHLENNSISSFEGMGDALWHADKQLLWGGFGFRTDETAYQYISDILNVPVITLKLISEHFYHLDTCLAILNRSTALVYKKAFTDESFAQIEHVFDHIIEADMHEAEQLFACNVVCADGENIVIQRGCEKTTRRLKRAGFTIHEVETSEFIKSGGSVFCMKMLTW